MGQGTPPTDGSSDDFVLNAPIAQPFVAQVCCKTELADCASAAYRTDSVSSKAPDGARRAVGTHHGPTRIHMAESGRLQPTPSEGRQSWHYDTLSSPHLPPPALVLKDDCWPPGAVTCWGWAPPPLPPGPQDLPRDYGPDGAALSRRTEAGVPRGKWTTHLRERADDRDSEPDYLL